MPLSASAPLLACSYLCLLANLEMRDSDPEARLQADLKASESFLNQRTLQLQSYEMSQHAQEQHAAAWPCNHLADNLEMRDSDPEATLEADLKASETFLNHSTLQLESSLMSHDGAANVGVRNNDNEAKLGTCRKTLKRSEMDGRTKAKEHEDKENEEAQLLRTPMSAVNKKAVGPRWHGVTVSSQKLTESWMDDGGAWSKAGSLGLLVTHHLVPTLPWAGYGLRCRTALSWSSLRAGRWTL